ncbi:DnaJ-domain-containing protein [Schizopora paradoxa]|uniref:DnaJ-domain-containing protein n=1 Tax=Schizopora paradoxa TaxID=27342 RepID=A0A0H2RP19_9AGAM|nr:DnaJ-domain-containing protein [Schizopora paradoxa]
MAPEELEINPYELLGVGVEATDGDVKSAYRKLSLKVHPDRNPNNPEAAQKFHELNQAYELLLDPLRRLALTSQIKAKEARKARFAKYDAKRKNLQEELEERERAFKKQKLDKASEDRKREMENERIKEQGRRLREEKEAELNKRVEEETVEDGDSAADEESEIPTLGHLDTTIKIKYNLTEYPDLKTSSSLASLLTQFGSMDEPSIVLSMKPPKKAPTKPPKFATALVPFKQIGDAFAAVCSSGREDRRLKNIDVSWAEGKEPKIIKWLKDKGMLGKESQPKQDPQPNPVPSSNFNKAASLVESASCGSLGFSSFPESFGTATKDEPKSASTSLASGLDYEAVTLMRLRQAERAKLEKELREQEENE